jgi:hypothetical protein
MLSRRHQNILQMLNSITKIPIISAYLEEVRMAATIRRFILWSSFQHFQTSNSAGSSVNKSVAIVLSPAALRGAGNFH